MNWKLAFKNFKLGLRNEPVEKVYMVQLDKPKLDELEKSLRRPFVDKETTQIEAGYLLGVQAVLNKLRNGV